MEITQIMLRRLLDSTLRYNMLKESDVCFLEGFIGEEATVNYPVLVTGVSLERLTEVDIMAGVEIKAEVKGVGYIPLFPIFVEPDYVIRCRSLSPSVKWVLHILVCVKRGDLVSQHITPVEVDVDKEVR